MGSNCEEVLPFCRDAVGVFYSCSQLGYHCEEVLPFYRDAVGVFYSCSQLGYHCEEVLPFCRDAVGVFYSCSQLGSNCEEVLPFNRDAVGVFYSCSQLGYHCEEVLPFCRDAVSVFYSCSRLVSHCEGVLPFCRDTVGVLYSCSRLGKFLVDDFLGCWFFWVVYFHIIQHFLCFLTSYFVQQTWKSDHFITKKDKLIFLFYTNRQTKTSPPKKFSDNNNQSRFFLTNEFQPNLVGFSCDIHQLQFCRIVRLPQRVS